MKKILSKSIRLFIAIFMAFFLISCATSRHLKTEEIRGQTISGNFNVILYGARYSGDVENVAILEIVDDGFTFDILAPDFDYKIKRDLTSEEAIKMAQSFIASHGAFKYPQVSQIKLPDGTIVGYEFRPLYSASEFGFFDVLDIDYWLDGNKIRVKIDLVPEVKKRLFIDETFENASQ